MQPVDSRGSASRQPRSLGIRERKEERARRGEKERGERRRSQSSCSFVEMTEEKKQRGFAYFESEREVD